MAGLYDELLVLLHGIWNRRWVALAVAWGVAMLGWLGVALIPNSYQSKARVYVNTQSLLEDRMGITQVQSQQDLDRLLAVVALVLGAVEVVGLVDEEDAAEGTFYDGLGLEGSILDGHAEWPASTTRKEWFAITRQLIQQTIADMDLDPVALAEVEEAFIGAGLL